MIFGGSSDRLTKPLGNLPTKADRNCERELAGLHPGLEFAEGRDRLLHGMVTRRHDALRVLVEQALLAG